MNQGGWKLPNNPFFITPQNQVDPNPYMNRRTPSGDNGLYRFPQTSETSSHLREYNRLDPLGSSTPYLKKFSECRGSDLDINHSNFKLPHNESSAVMEPPLSKRIHLLESQVIESPASTLNITAGRKTMFTGTFRYNHIKKPIPKKPRPFSDGQHQCTTACNTSSLRAGEASRKMSDGCNDTSVSLQVVDSMKETDNEIIALKDKIDSLYSKLHEIQQQRQHAILNISGNDGSTAAVNCNNTANISNGGSRYLNVANEAVESACYLGEVIPKICHLSKHNQHQINEEINLVKSAEIPGDLCDRWKHSVQSKKTDLIGFQKIGNSSKTCRVNTLKEVQADPLNNHLGEPNSASPLETIKNPVIMKSRLLPSSMTADHKDQHRSSAPDKIGTANAATTMKRIQEFWDVTYLSSHIKKINSTESKEISKPCFPQAIHPAKSKPTVMELQQPRFHFQPPGYLGSLLCFYNTPTQPCFANPYNPLSQPEVTQFVTSAQVPHQFLSTITAPIQPLQRHPIPLLHNQFPPIHNPINVIPNRLINNLLPLNSYTAEQKLLFKNGFMSPLVRKKLLQPKLRNVHVQTVSPSNRSVNVGNAATFMQETQDRNISDQEDESIANPKVEIPSNNAELQQFASTTKAFTMVQPTMM